jgi:hypothetical protein
MEKIKNTLGISKSDDMSGIDADQSALMQNEEFVKETNNPEASAGKDINYKQLNSSGGPNYGRESKIPEHESAPLNKQVFPFPRVIPCPAESTPLPWPLASNMCLTGGKG